MKCGVCADVLGNTWYSVAARMASGTIYVTNVHRECLSRELGAPGLRRIDRVMLHAGWVQERLPV